MNFGSHDSIPCASSRDSTFFSARDCVQTTSHPPGVSWRESNGWLVRSVGGVKRQDQRPRTIEGTRVHGQSHRGLARPRSAILLPSFAVSPKLFDFEPQLLVLGHLPRKELLRQGGFRRRARRRQHVQIAEFVRAIAIILSFQKPLVDHSQQVREFSLRRRRPFGQRTHHTELLAIVAVGRNGNRPR